MRDAVKNYLALANGVTEVTRQRAIAAAKALVSSGEATAEQVSNLTEDLLTNSRNNRDAVLALIRYEIDRALTRLGLATAEEVESLQRRIVELEAQLRRSARAGSTAGTGDKADDDKAEDDKTDGQKAPAKKAPAEKAPAKKAPAKKASAQKATSQGAPAKKAPAKKAAAQKATAQQAPAKKAAPRKAPAKRAGGSS